MRSSFQWERLALMAYLAVMTVGGSQVARGDGQDQQRVEEILTRLESRSDGLRDIRAQVQFLEDDQVNLTKRTKSGTVSFLMSRPNPRFLIAFERTEMDGIVGKREWYLFDGRSLYEVVERIGQVTQSEIAPSGETIDLFDLETTPFPLPFGQKKESILRNFVVTLKEPQQNDPANTDHLLCTPKSESPFYRKYKSIEFFVHRTLHLPTRIVVTKGDGFETITADFPDLTERSLNNGLAESEFDPPPEWREKFKWVVEGPGAAVVSEPRE